MIEKCNSVGKPVITATQMLDSMVRNPRPTRAEVTDVANAIFDGTDAVMLSGETAVGQYPVEAVRMMDRIARKSEEALDYASLLDGNGARAGRSVADAIARATCETAADLKVAAILCSTQSGATARMVSKYRPRSPIMAMTPNAHVARQPAVVWGVAAFASCPRCGGLTRWSSGLRKRRRRAAWSRTATASPSPPAVLTGTPGSTNLLQIHVVGEETHRQRGNGPYSGERLKYVIIGVPKEIKDTKIEWG